MIQLSFVRRRHRVIAAGMFAPPRIAPHNTFDAKPYPRHDTMNFDCLDHVLRASRCKSACIRRQERRDDYFVQPKQGNQYRGNSAYCYAQCRYANRMQPLYHARLGFADDCLLFCRCAISAGERSAGYCADLQCRRIFS